MTNTTTDAAEARAGALEALARTYEEDNLHDTAWHVREGGLNGHEQRAVRAVMLATAEAASGAGEREGPYVAGPIWAEPEDDCFTAEIQIVGGHAVAATVHGATRDEAERRQAAVLRALASLPPATDPAMVTVTRALLAPFAALADEWDRWQAKGSTSTPNMVRISYGRVRFGLPEYQAVRAALAAAPTIPATGHAATEPVTNAYNLAATEGEGASHADRT